MKKRLLFVISQFCKGGAETSLLNLFKYLDKSKYDIDFIIMNQTQMENAVSLVPQIPAEIHVLDAQKVQKRISPTRMLKERLLLTAQEKFCDPAAALLFVRNKKYDWAFHIGEWWPPAFVALRVKADHKAAWIHNDISQAEYFRADDYFSYDNFFDKYIFVSQNSMASSLAAYPFITKKSSCVYNLNDALSIRRQAKEAVDETYFRRDLPVLLTCANVRGQKNHRRQLEAMAILKKRGLDFIWLNIGATTETDRCKALLNRAKELGLEDRFILAGPRENPYQYMACADAVTVLSDYESWSMVITEAKILGVPVISTRTSGALEQIVDGETGVLTEFSAVDIADKIEKFLLSEKLRQHICDNLGDFDNTKEILTSFDEFVTAPFEAHEHRKGILYIIDDINYRGGAHYATKLQIRELLKDGHEVAVFSSSCPTAEIRTELGGVRFLSWPDFPEDALYNRRIMDCLTDPALTKDEKQYKLRLTWEGKIRKNPEVFQKMVFPHLSKLFSGYRSICVMSEGSAFREVVAGAECNNKVQWIHTDYCAWKDTMEWTKEITANDGELYCAYDRIVVLTDSIREGFVRLYPHLAAKVTVNMNLLPDAEIRKKSAQDDSETEYVHFVTVGRISYEKALERLYGILLKLFQNGYRFYWTFIGSGDEFRNICSLFSKSVLAKYVTMKGELSNPFPLVKKADVFALLSYYEGLPNTIFESLIIGTPVLATAVGGIPGQITVGENGWLVENDEESIYQGLEHILQHPEEIKQFRENLKAYQYDNAGILQRAKEILYSPQGADSDVELVR